MSIFKTVVRVLFAAFFIFAGIRPFTIRDFFIAIVPPYLPWPEALVYISGVSEILLGTLLMFPRTARLAGWGFIALLLAVFPANIHMAMNPDLVSDHFTEGALGPSAPCKVCSSHWRIGLLAPSNRERG